MAQRSSLARRLRAIETKRNSASHQLPVAMTDEQLMRAVNVRDPVNGTLRMDLTDDELWNVVRAVRRAP